MADASFLACLTGQIKDCESKIFWKIFIFANQSRNPAPLFQHSRTFQVFISNQEVRGEQDEVAQTAPCYPCLLHGGVIAALDSTRPLEGFRTTLLQRGATKSYTK